ncbi:DUF4082 domain-containing protein [Nocardioides sp. InS609-2]|uniref:DUF4082 domain-containing protein n=1 Tax=Nocardioides sp. InS609-2 TaxID=2760705 RepID=UPI0020BF0043|nr:DUF4082 domain-containing protein [Nocardioides sp. InS609-2]
MGFKSIVAALCAVALASVGFASPAAVGKAEPTGLWPTGFAAQQTSADCGKWSLDENGFCVANDSRNGLEVGVKFQSSRELSITGIRIYRAEPATVPGSLWNSAGTLLARGTFAARSGNGWQDMSFAHPVTIAPGKTYVASYFTPGTKYAFSYGYFAKSGRTVGPITALRSVDADPNGVHCYDDAECGSFPVRGYRDSAYWVTPLWQEPGGGTNGSTVGPTTDATKPTADNKAPVVATMTPRNRARRVKVGVNVTATFSEAVRSTGLTSSTVRLLRKGSTKLVATKIRYDAKAHRVVLNPRSALRRATAYRVVISSDVRDLADNRLDQNPTKSGLQQARWTFRTR